MSGRSSPAPPRVRELPGRRLGEHRPDSCPPLVAEVLVHPLTENSTASPMKPSDDATPNGRSGMEANAPRRPPYLHPAPHNTPPRRQRYLVIAASPARRHKSPPRRTSGRLPLCRRASLSAATASRRTSQCGDAHCWASAWMERVWASSEAAPATAAAAAVQWRRASF